jgi:hypothetical protein
MYRLGIDLDKKCQWELLMRYFNLKDAFPNEDIVVYETRRGYHLVLPNVKTDLELRMIFGDDTMRIEFEEARSKAHNREPQDILFHTKRVMRDGKTVFTYTREVVDVMSEPFWKTGAGCC